MPDACAYGSGRHTASGSCKNRVAFPHRRTPLLDTPGQYARPALSPDGKRPALSAIESGVPSPSVFTNVHEHPRLAWTVHGVDAAVRMANTPHSLVVDPFAPELGRYTARHFGVHVGNLPGLPQRIDSLEPVDMSGMRDGRSAQRRPLRSACPATT
jgi:hypothetical protein